MSWLRDLRQYQPYAVAVLVVVAVANLVPRSEATSAPRIPVEAAAAVEATTTTTSTVGVGPVALDTTQAPAPSVAASPLARPTTTTTVAARPVPEGPAAQTELRIVASGYASGEVTVGDPAVPDDGLPVGTGARGASRISFVRLAGSASILRLVLVEDERAHRLADLASVLACPITGEWDAVRDQPMSDAPPYDCAQGVVGSRPDARTFEFDLSALAPAAGGNGFALVPGADTMGFYVTLSIHTLGES